MSEPSYWTNAGKNLGHMASCTTGTIHVPIHVDDGVVCVAIGATLWHLSVGRNGFHCHNSVGHHPQHMATNYIIKETYGILVLLEPTGFARWMGRGQMGITVLQWRNPCLSCHI